MLEASRTTPRDYPEWTGFERRREREWVAGSTAGEIRRTPNRRRPDEQRAAGALLGQNVSERVEDRPGDHEGKSSGMSREASIEDTVKRFDFSAPGVLSLGCRPHRA